jgi:hypothetical protein
MAGYQNIVASLCPVSYASFSISRIAAPLFTSSSLEKSATRSGGKRETLV